MNQNLKLLPPLNSNVRLPMRYLQTYEIPLVKYLIRKAGLTAEFSNLDRISVKSMKDGGMGSLRFITNTTNPKLSSVAAECLFHDSDGIKVSATLNLDQNGQLFELDIWKVNFDPLLKWPQ